MKRNYLVLAVLLYFPICVHAADIASDVRAGSGGYDNSDGGYFEFGVGFSLLANSNAARIESSILMAGAYRYRSFFLEALNPGISLNDGTVGGLSIGVNLWRTDRWAVDLLGANTIHRSSNRISEIDLTNSEQPQRDKELFARNSFYAGTGFRLTGYYGNAIFQYRLINDFIKDNGIISSARIGYSRQVKNWNYHGVVSANYVSKETSQYWYGVSDAEATALIPEYEIRSSTINYAGEIGVTYPLREHLVFRSTARYVQLDEAATNSPLQEGDFRFRWNTSISYVF